MKWDAFYLLFNDSKLIRSRIRYGAWSQKLK